MFMAHVIVMGAGIGGIPAAFALRKHLGKEHRVTLIGARPYFEFTPSNPWIAVGWRTAEKTRVPLAEPLEKKGIKWQVGEVKSIDPQNCTLTLSDGQCEHYDYLVVATGPKLAFEEIPGLGPAKFTQSVCTHEHALLAWERYQEFVKNPGPVVIGAAPGASCFGPAYETAMIIDADLRKRKIRDRVPMTYVTSEPYIGHMGLGGVGDSKGLMESELRERHIKWITNAKISSVDEKEMSVLEVDDTGAAKKEHKLPFAFSMVIPAFKGVDAVAAVPELNNPRGFVLVDSHQRSKKYRNIFSVGVCIAIAPVEATPVATGAPKTGYMIESMVSAVAENICMELAGKPATAEATWNAICLADFGDTGAAFVAIPQIPPRNITWSKKGKWVHLAKVAFEKYFLRKVRTGSETPIYETYVLKALGLAPLKR
ncbi:MAG: FAD/NAD(P)-binding oxidoreductase [Steroidobacteraceae bacterium]